MKDASGKNGTDVGGQGSVCERCGPYLRLLDREGNRLVTFAEALVQAGFGILRGEIVGVRGFGEMHYLVDARLDGAISRLRLKGNLAGKELPLMYPSVSGARVDFAVSAFDEDLLTAPDIGPVKLLRMRSPKETPLAAAGAGPDPVWFPILLARTRLHRLLLSQLNGPVVAVDQAMIGKERSAKNLGFPEPVADFVLELTCPAWDSEEGERSPNARCALADRPENSGLKMSIKRSLP
jgi:hydrogenase maturation factor HypF (carbamoyltransferase family)